MRGWRTYVVALLSAALVGLPAVAGAAGTGNPAIAAFAPGAKHYSGFNGPFIVDLSEAPFDTTYQYFVDRVPDGGGTPVLVGTKRSHRYDAGNAFEKPQLRVSALGPGAYTFHVTDNAGHEDSLGFTVSTGKPPACSIVLPSQVRMKARSAVVTARLSATCRTLNTTYAAWEARDQRGNFAQTFIFSNASTDRWRIYDDERTGTYTVRPNSAKSGSNETLPQNTARLKLKMESRLNLTSKRSGSFVTLRTRSTRYAPDANRFRVWSKRKVVLSYRTCETCAWKRLKTRTTDRNGLTSYRFKASKVRQYRAIAVGTSKTWAPRADVVRR